MQLACFSKKFAGGLIAVALCTSSTGAIAASATQSAAQSRISPLVALSALGSDASRAALCGASAAAAAGAAAAAQGAAQGCVLPVVDQAQPVAEVLPPPPVAPPPVPPSGGGFGISPLLLALAGIAAEIVITGRHDEGAAGAIGSDLDLATRLATTLEAVNGMGDTMVSEPYRGEPELRRIRQTNSIIWQRVEKTLHMALDQAKALIGENRDPILAIAQELLRAKSVTGDEIQTLLSNKSLTIAKVDPSVGDNLKRSA